MNGELSMKRTSAGTVSVVMAVLTMVLGTVPAFAAPGEAPQGASPKSHYHLFRPVPRHRMRELSADRPDGTESAITVDPGHFQAELSFFDFTRDKAGARTDTWAFGDLNLKLGLLSHVDLHLGFAVYNLERTRALHYTGIHDAPRKKLWACSAGGGLSDSGRADRLLEQERR